MSDPVILDVDSRGIATITINRPEVRNAFNESVILRLTELLVELGDHEDLRAVVVTGAGSAFSSGADVNWMRSMADYSEDQNFEDALQLADLMATLSGFACPTLARVNGLAFGGGVGLVACCDIAIASTDAMFALSEVRLGLVPAVISPYVIDAIGPRQAKRYFLTGERISAVKAREIGLVHRAVDPESLDEAIEETLAMLLLGGPMAARECKELIATVYGRSVDADTALRRKTAEIIAQLRAGEEGQEGLQAFLEKRKPSWVKEA
jgi:methylglutaconyl-CoA hydratase